MANIISASIPPGQALSGPIGIGSTPMCIMLPPNWMNPVLMTFQMSPDGGATWYDVYHSNGTEYTLTVVPGAIAIFDLQLNWASMIRLRSGSGRAPIPQPQGCNLQMVLYP